MKADDRPRQVVEFGIVVCLLKASDMCVRERRDGWSRVFARFGHDRDAHDVRAISRWIARNGEFNETMLANMTIRRNVTGPFTVECGLDLRWHQDDSLAPNGLCGRRRHSTKRKKSADELIIPGPTLIEEGRRLRHGCRNSAATHCWASEPSASNVSWLRIQSRTLRCSGRSPPNQLLARSPK